MKNVYHLEHGLNKMYDGRVNPTYSTGQVILPVLFGFLLRIKSFNELNFMIKNHEFNQLFPRGTKLPQIDAIRDALKVIDLEGLKQINYHIIKKSVENKVFEDGTIDGYEVWEDEKEFEKVEVQQSTFTMDNVEQPLRFVKFAIKHQKKLRTQIMIVTTCMDMTLKTLFKIIRARWDIENSIFNNLKRDCGLEHCFVHGGNAVEAVLSLIFIASNIMQLFLIRRLRNHFATQREVVRLLLKGLYLLKYRAELVFSSS